MRTAALAVVCVLVLLAGCSAISPGSDATTDVSDGETTSAATTGPASATEATDAAATAGNATNGSGTSAPDATPGPGETDAGMTNGTTDATNTTDTTGGESSATTGTNASEADALPDPASDRLGWEGGYWYNESVSVSAADGFNASERAATANRTMARIERIRQLEFNQSVPVSVVSREEFQRSGPMSGGDPSAAFRAFDNTKFEALFMIGEGEDSVAVQQSDLNQTVAGYYSPQRNAIVVVSESDTPRLARSTLSHELVHALQDQQFGFSVPATQTRDAANAQDGATEGEANYVQRRYETRCEGEWSCLAPVNRSTNASNASASDLNRGVYFLQFFPYAAGPGFVDAIYDQQGWEGVNALHEDFPASTEQVIHPERYGNDTPTNLSIEQRGSGEWSRVRLDRPNRPDYATLGQSALSSMFGATLYDEYNRSSVVEPTEFLNIVSMVTGEVNTSDPINYDLSVTNGWDGDRMHVYRNGDGETGYVWKLAWDSPEEAEEFVTGYEALLSHWGGEPTGNGTWTIPEDSNSPFADAFSVQREGDTVTIVNAPTADGLDALRSGSS